MSSNSVNVEDSEMAECEGEKVVTMMDVLQEQQEFEEDANAVLGASDDKNCTYNKGYIKRQALYACLTCCSEAKHDPDKRAGICLACSLTCHENHELVELYTKRNFRCDCGNPKFKQPCQYTENKSTLNDENTYNQNFSGLYCICHRPYPDPDEVEEEMIQCIVCEDWLHASHLEATVPSAEVYAEMICKTCMDKNVFLHDYTRYAVNNDIDTVESSVHYNGDTYKINGVDIKTDLDKTESDKINVTDELKKVDNPTDALNKTHEHIDENKTEEQIEPNVSSKDNNNEQPVVDDTVANINVSSKDSDNEHPVVDETVENINVSSKDNVNEHPVVDNTVENINISSKDNDNEHSAVENTDENTNVSSKDNDNETPVVDNIVENIASDKKDMDNLTEGILTKEIVANNTHPTEKKQAKDTNEENTTTSLEIPDSKLGDNVDSVVNSEDPDNLHAAKEQANGTTDVTDVSINEQNNQEIPADMQQESSENDASTDQQTTDIANEDLKVDTQEKQVPTDSTSNADENGDNLVVDNHSGEEIKENKRKLSTEEDTLDISVKKPKLSESDCIRPRGEKKRFKGATFWPCHFRQKLCTCNECITMYKDLSVLFLIDPEDTVTAYEVLGKEKADGAASTQYEKGLEALSSLGRIQQINALTEYNKMRDKLLDYLKSFKDRKEIVKEEDIKAFFAGMKPKREPDGVYFCR